MTTVGQNQKCSKYIENKHRMVMLHMQKHGLHKFEQPVTNRKKLNAEEDTNGWQNSATS